MDLYDIAVARKLSGGGGGGGSSDASTATITLVDPGEMGYILLGPFYSESHETAKPKCFTDDGEVGVLLYKNSAQVDATNVLEEGGTISVSGNATLEDAFVIITGDCTITVS